MRDKCSLLLQKSQVFAEKPKALYLKVLAKCLRRIYISLQFCNKKDYKSDSFSAF